MLADALKYLTELVRKADAPGPIDLKDPRRVGHVIAGEPFIQEVPFPPRNHQVNALEALVSITNRFASGEAAPVVWYDHSDVVLVIDDGANRLERVTFDIEPSDVFTTLCKLYISPGAAWLEQKPFLRLLRVDLAGTLDPVHLLERVRKLRFENGTVTTGKIAPNKSESLGREIIAKVDADGELPEQVILNVPVSRSLGETARYPMSCSVEVDPAMGKLRLLPMPDEIERVRTLHVGSIAERLHEGLSEGINAYHGRP